MQTCGLEAVSAHRRGCLPHLPAESPCTLLTMLFCSERLSPVREAQGERKKETTSGAGSKNWSPAAKKSTCNPLPNDDPLTEHNTRICNNRKYKPKLHPCTRCAPRTTNGGQAVQELGEESALPFQPLLCASHATVFPSSSEGTKPRKFHVTPQ